MAGLFTLNCLSALHFAWQAGMAGTHKDSGGCLPLLIGIKAIGRRLIHPGYFLLEKNVDGGLDFIELSSKEVVCTLDPMDALGFRKRGEESLDLVARPVDIFGPLDDQLRFGRLAKKGQVGRGGGKAQPDQAFCSRVARAHCESNPRAKGKTHQADRLFGKPRQEVIKRRTDVVALAGAFGVFSLALADAAKVEAQRRETQRGGRFGGAKDNFVVKRAAKLRVRMTHQRRQARIASRVPLEQSFEPSNRARDKDSFELRAHVLVLREAVGARREASGPSANRTQ